MQALCIDLKRSRGWCLGLALAVSATSACSGVCDDKPDGCMALQVLGNDSGDQVSIEILDAYGHQLARRHTLDTPARELVEIPVEGYDPAIARCVRVAVGKGPTRRTGLLRVKNWSAGSRIESTVMLSQPPPQAQFGPLLSAILAGPGRSVAIGRVPKTSGPRLLVGSAPMGKGAVEFFTVDSGSIQHAAGDPLALDAPPYPLILAGNTENSAVLLVGANPLEATGPTLFSPRVFGGQGAGFVGAGVKLPFVDGNTNAQTTFVAAADLNGDDQLEVVANWHDSKAIPEACGTALFAPMGQSYAQQTTIASLSAGPGACRGLSALTLANVDGDSRPDIIRSLDGELTVSLNMPSGIFTAPILVIPANPKRDLLGLTTGDLNGDYFRDVVISTNSDPSQPNTYGKTVNFAFGQAGALERPDTWQKGSLDLQQVQPRAAVAVDLNGDFLDDVLVANYGDGTNPAQPSIVYGDSQQISVVGTLSQGTTQLFDVAAGDLDGDCQADIAFVGRLDNQVYVFLNKSVIPQ